MKKKKKHQPSVYINNKDILKNKKNTQDFFFWCFKTLEYTSSFEYYCQQAKKKLPMGSRCNAFCSFVDKPTHNKEEPYYTTNLHSSRVTINWRKHCYKLKLKSIRCLNAFNHFLPTGKSIFGK